MSILLILVFTSIFPAIENSAQFVACEELEFQIFTKSYGMDYQQGNSKLRSLVPVMSMAGPSLVPVREARNELFTSEFLVAAR